MALIEIKHRYTGEVLHSGEYADLREAVIAAVKQYANLQYANLQYANLQSANLQYANLQSANLQYAENADLPMAQTLIVPDGDLRVWKQCRNNVLIHLLIPNDARRSCATGRKCRAEFADVLEVIGAEVGISLHDGKTRYVKGERVTCDKWEENRFIECGGGLHFYLTRIEAENN
jgi:hypothetical protein